MIDFLNSSEASGLGRALTSARKSEAGARFKLGENALVLDEDDTPMQPGSGRPGRLAVRGPRAARLLQGRGEDRRHLPRDRRRSLRRARRLCPGGTGRQLSPSLGRGSVSINTGGEKVFPEEVEEAVKTFPAVRDAVVGGRARSALRPGSGGPWWRPWPVARWKAASWWRISAAAWHRTSCQGS